MSSSTMAHDKRYTKHGFPKGFRFVPTNLELITILSYKVHGRRLPPKVAAIFHELNILDYHPDELHDMYEHDKEHRYIYFFSYRQRQRSADGGGPVHKKRQRGAGGGQDEDDSNEPRPVRLAKGGGWKPSGGGHALYWPKDKGGFVAGKMVTMVFYDHHVGQEQVKSQQVKSQWGMHEFTIPLDPRLLPKPTKTTRLQLHELALYRLYKLKSGDMEGDDGAGSSNQTPANVPAAAAGGGHFSAPCPTGQPSFGIFPGQNQPLNARASTSRMPPPPPQLQHHRIPNVAGHPQFYHQHHQYAFGGAQASAAHHQVRTMTMPPAYGARMLPGRQLSQFARPPGTTWLPAGPQSLQFARPPAPSQMPVLPAAGNPASSHQQAPAKATYGGVGQQASHSGATRSQLPSAPVFMPPPAADNPLAEEMAPMTAATHGGTGQEAGGDFGATHSSPAEQDATAVVEPGQHVQFADCVIKPEETVPPQIPADNDVIGMPEFDIYLGVPNDNCLFTMDELYAMLDEPPPTQLQGGYN